jgi:ribosomal protein S18 acetylase RimI-like enzyme
LKSSIQNTTPKDLPSVYALFEHAMEYQRKNSDPVWRGYDKDALMRDIEAKQQYKIVIDNQVALVFSVLYSDPVIWRHYEKGDAIYLHRIAVHPDFKGQKLFDQVLLWATNDAASKKLRFIRMDTWGENQKLIEYYLGFGFRFVDNFTTPDSAELPKQNRKLYLALLEMRV